MPKVLLNFFQKIAVSKGGAASRRWHKGQSHQTYTLVGNVKVHI